MGAHDISFGMPKKATLTELLVKMREYREEDAEVNGHQHGYSGDWQTIPSIKSHLHKTFDSQNDAHDYCMEHAEKGMYAIAVYYKTETGEIWTHVAGWAAS